MIRIVRQLSFTSPIEQIRIKQLRDLCNESNILLSYKAKLMDLIQTTSVVSDTELVMLSNPKSESTSLEWNYLFGLKSKTVSTEIRVQAVQQFFNAINSELNFTKDKIIVNNTKEMSNLNVKLNDMKVGQIFSNLWTIVHKISISLHKKKTVNINDLINENENTEIVLSNITELYSQLSKKLQLNIEFKDFLHFLKLRHTRPTELHMPLLSMDGVYNFCKDTNTTLTDQDKRNIQSILNFIDALALKCDLNQVRYSDIKILTKKAVEIIKMNK